MVAVQAPIHTENCTEEGTADTRKELQFSSVRINLCPWEGQSEDDDDFGCLSSLFKMRKVHQEADPTIH